MGTDDKRETDELNRAAEGRAGAESSGTDAETSARIENGGASEAAGAENTADGKRRLPKWLKLPAMKKRTQRILTVSAVAALAAVLCAAAFFIMNKDSLRLNGNYRVSLIGDHTDFSGKLRLRYDQDENASTLSQGERSLRLLGTPVYSLDEDMLVLTRQMSYTNFQVGRIRRLNYFGRAYYENGSAWLSRDGKKRSEVGAGYLYDGKHTFVFLEPMELRAGAEKIALSPLSFVTTGAQGFYYYDQESETERYVTGKDAKLYAAAANGTYTINLSNSTVELANGKSFLLIPNPETFPLID